MWLILSYHLGVEKGSALLRLSQHPTAHFTLDVDFHTTSKTFLVHMLTFTNTKLKPRF